MKSFAVCLIFILAAPTLARADYFSPEAAAQASANILNEAKTIQGIIDHLSLSRPQEEVKGLIDFFKKSTDQKIPHAKAIGKRIVFEGQKNFLEFNSDRSIRIGTR